MEKDETTPEGEQVQETTTDTEVVVEESEEVSEEPVDNKLRAKINIQNRLLRKEGYEFVDGKWVKPETKKEVGEVKSSSDLSTRDVIALSKANIHEEDIDDVVEYAKFKKISVPEALKSNYIQTTLRERGEERKTASVTQTKGGARGAQKTSGEALLEKAESTGELPTTPEGMTALAEARIARLKNKNKR